MGDSAQKKKIIDMFSEVQETRNQIALLENLEDLTNEWINPKTKNKKPFKHKSKKKKTLKGKGKKSLFA